MKIEMTSKDGVTLLTAGKYCKENIQVVPAFEPEPEPVLTPTEGLAYSKSSTYATCTGIGTATDRDIVIASEYEGLPVTSIGSTAFRDCYLLTSVHIPDGVTSIGTSAFRDCKRLTSVTLGNGVTSFGTYAFQGCSALTSIEIPEGVTSIGTELFRDCSALASVHIPDGVTSIRNRAFLGCSALANINIPDSVTSISGSAFYECYALANINIPDGVKTISDSAFMNCYSLTSVHIPDGVTSIPSQAFANCKSLTSIEIPEGVTSIGGSAFYYCSKLASIEIPDGVTSIGNTAFQGCSALTKITVNAITPPTLGTMAFTSIASNAVIYVPEESVEAYKSATNWSSYASRIQAIKVAGLLSIGDFNNSIITVTDGTTNYANGDLIPFGTTITITATVIDSSAQNETLFVNGNLFTSGNSIVVETDISINTYQENQALARILSIADGIKFGLDNVDLLFVGMNVKFRTQSGVIIISPGVRTIIYVDKVNNYCYVSGSDLTTSQIPLGSYLIFTTDTATA